MPKELKKAMLALGLGILLFNACQLRNQPGSDSPGKANHLAGQTSPYLLRHAYNPVDWYPWGEQALTKARMEDKMLMISIGYAACHWCHVMEEESFGDTAVARVMNQHFVSVKVDREERPDLDDIYLTACQLSSDRGCGWPLNVFALPDGRPVWAGTYFPRKNWLEILDYFIRIKEEEREKLEAFADRLTEGLSHSDQILPPRDEQVFQLDELEKQVESYLKRVDIKYGAQMGAPKFPMPNCQEWLLDFHYRSGRTAPLQAVLTTLDQMSIGGIYDQLGGGFARYSTDGEWKIPHFEKMLYDNAQLISLYAKAYQLTGRQRYARIIEETADFVAREFTSGEGGFFTSLDADSEGEEGKYYIWTQAQIDSILQDEQLASLFSAYYEVKRYGNWENGKNILYNRIGLEDLSASYRLPADRLADLLSDARKRLLEARHQRISPPLDDKILTAWNGLMISGYCDAYRATGQERFLQAARRNASFLLKNTIRKDYRINRNYKAGKASINGFLDDYAFTIRAFVELYECTFDEQWLRHAEGLADYAIAHFYDTGSGLFFFTSDLDPPLVARRKEVNDNVIPSSNSEMALNLYQLGTLLDRREYLEKASDMALAVSRKALTEHTPEYYSNWLQVLAHLAAPPFEVAIVGPGAEQVRKSLQAHYLPNVFFLGGTDEGTLELLKDKLVDGETFIYVCRNKICKLPVADPREALAQLK